MDASLYTRPNKPRTMVVKRRWSPAQEQAKPELPELLEVDTFTECHVTPLDVAGRMVDYLEATSDQLTLEPQAGTGNLIQALFESGHSACELVAIERHHSLCSAIRQRFQGKQSVNPIQQCFLEYAEEAKGKIEFPRIIMNPPFKHVKRHMKAALDLLGLGGHSEAVLVALVPITYQHDEAETLEELPNDTFSAAKVYTKIIRIIRD